MNRYCPVCERFVDDQYNHVREHLIMREHREHDKKGIICNCGVRK